MRNRNIDVTDIADQHIRFTAAGLRTKVAAEAFFEVFGFTDIDHRTGRVIHSVDARLAGYGAEKGFGIKEFTHYLLMAPR